MITGLIQLLSLPSLQRGLNDANTISAAAIKSLDHKTIHVLKVCDLYTAHEKKGAIEQLPCLLSDLTVILRKMYD